MVEMNVPNAELKARAKSTLRGTYWTLFAAGLIVAAVTGGLSAIFKVNDDSTQLGLAALVSLLSLALNFFVTIPLTLGLSRMFIRTAQGCKADFNEILYIYRSGSLLNAILVQFLQGLFIALWSLLLVIPGIIKAFSYFMMDYMLAENPALDQARAFELSKQIMNGNKGKAFLLGLSFIGWILLSALTFGIGTLFLTPYMSMTFTHFYLELKERAIQSGIIRPEDNLYAVRPQEGPEF